MPLDILASDYIVPGVYAQINLAVGPGTAAVGARDVLLIGPKLSAATWNAGQKYEVTSESEVIAGAGSGSVLHRLTRWFLKGNRKSRLYVMPVAPTSGGTPVAATLARTLTGTPTAGGWVDVLLEGEQIRYVFGTSDTVTTIAAGLVALINGRTWLSVTASNVAGVLTLTAKTAGASQSGNIFVVTTVDAGKGITWSAASGFVGDTAVGADGTTTEAAGYDTCFTNLLADGTYYLVVGNSSTTVLSSLHSHLAACADPRVGLRKRGIVGFVGTKAAAQALAIARNYERLSIVTQKNGYYDNAELAATYASVVASLEEIDPTNVPIDFSDGSFPLQAAPFTADWYTQTDINDLLTDGVVPIASFAAGARIIDGVTTRSKDSTKTYDDFRALYQERISACDYFAADILSMCAKTFKGKKLAPDTLLPDGTVDLQQEYPVGVVKPQMIRDAMKGRILFWESNGLITNAAKAIKGLNVKISTVNGQRVNIGVDLQVVAHVRQLAAVINEVSEG